MKGYDGEPDRQLIAETGDFLDMMRRAYHEVRRRRRDNGPPISITTVLAK